MDVFADEASPLASAVRDVGIATLTPVDSHASVGGCSHDLASPLVFAFFLRLAWTGCIALAAASPPCSDYSRLRERPDGPRAIRTHDDLNPSPDLTGSERLAFDTSRTLHASTVAFLHVVHVMGGHVTWDVPPTSIATCEPSVVDVCDRIAAHLAYVAA